MVINRGMEMGVGDEFLVGLGYSYFMVGDR